jgi:hypothetical protein
MRSKSLQPAVYTLYLFVLLLIHYTHTLYMYVQDAEAQRLKRARQHDQQQHGHGTPLYDRYVGPLGIRCIPGIIPPFYINILYTPCIMYTLLCDKEYIPFFLGTYSR